MLRVKWFLVKEGKGENAFFLLLRMFDGCSAQISDHQLLIIGAYYSREQVMSHS